MNGKTMYLAVLLVALCVSTLTSYITTSLYLSSIPVQSADSGKITVSDLSPEVIQQLADDIGMQRANVSLPFEVSYFAAGDSLIEVHCSQALDNLTIVYQYTRLSDGVIVVEKIDYGSFIPAWGAGTVIESGALPQALYKIPDTILEQCAKTTVNSAGCLVFEDEPQLEVLGVYGYA